MGRDGLGMAKWLSRIGVSFTILYFVLLWFVFRGRFDDVLTLRPNELGDLLAGVFGPLAILWLILGYFQQGIELRQNTQALSLQAEELKKSSEALALQVDEMRRSGEQQARMAQLTADQMKLQAERLAADEAQRRAGFEPRFEIREDVRFADKAPGIGQVKLLNSGASITVLRVNSNFGDDIVPTKMEDWISGVTNTFVPYREGRPPDLPVLIEVLFRQHDGRLRCLEITMDAMSESVYGPTELKISETDD